MPDKNKSEKALPIIGSITTVDFFDFGIENVPAKVDTGAFTSSVWASQIEEKDGTLSFALFKSGSPWYNGEIIKTEKYKTRKVKNSFGESELRYQVSLSVKIEGKRMKINATLANRENNRFPILIGKRTLNKKFLVDVSQSVNEANDEIKRMAVIVSRGGEEAIKGLEKVQEIVGDAFEIDVVRFNEIKLEINEHNVDIELGKRNLRQYHQLYFFSRVKNEQVAAVVAAQARKYGILFMDTAADRLYPNGKLHQYAVLSGQGVKIPDTVFVYNNRWPEMFELIEQKLGLPFIFKDNAGRKGRHNYLVESKTEFLRLVNEAEEDSRLMLAQKFIPNEGYYRFLTLGGQVEFISYRQINIANSHFFKKENGFPAEKIPVSEIPFDVLNIAMHASNILEIDVAGVDMLQEKGSGDWYCIEVNSSPQLVSGSFVDEKLAATAKFFMQKMESN